VKDACRALHKDRTQGAHALTIALPTLNSIKTKLVLIVLAGIVSAMLLTAILTGWQAADRRFHGLKDELDSIALTLAIAVAPAQAAGTYHDVQKILRAIGRMPKVNYARVLAPDGDLIAAFGNGVLLQRDAGLVDPNEKPGLLKLLTMKTYPAEAPIIQGGKNVGTLLLIADVSELRGVLAESFKFAMLWSLLAAMAGLLVALRLAKSLTGPILDLTRAMHDIRESHNFSKKVERHSNDETGDLVDAFNDMLNEIRTRDAALAKHRETLEQTVEERTRDLKQATIAAQEANAAKSDFLATMSHEIRTPMNGMLVMAELLTASDLPTRLQRYADVIVSSGKSLLSIINDILDFSKIEAGRLKLEAIPVEPRKLVDEVTRLFAEHASSKGLDLAGFVAPDVPKVIAADPVRLNQILSNLVNNALKFTETGGVAIRLLRAVDNDDEMTVSLRFEVSDTGIGIEEDKVATIFEAFSQADQSTTRKFGGTGIGLAICQRLSQAMNGVISVTSTFGVGSTFALEATFEVLEPSAQLERPNRLATGDVAPKVLIAMEPGPTRDALFAYARAHNFEPVVPAPQDDPDRLRSTLRIASSVPATISKSDRFVESLRQRLPEMKIVTVSRFGQSCGADPNADRCADVELSWPLVADEATGLFSALASGDLSALHYKKAAQSQSQAFATFPGVRVLAADDSAINREVLGEALRRLQVEVVNVEDGTEAVEAVKSKPFDLVFMDGSMPRMDGFEATRQIRAWETETGRSPMPIVALTAHVVGSQANLWRDAGMDDCVTKPFTIATLEKTLSALLAERRVDPAVAELEPSAPINTNGPAHTAGTGRKSPQAEAPVYAPEATEQSELPLFDDEVLDSIREMQTGDMDLATKVIGLYRTHAPDALAALSVAWPSEPDDTIAKAAHALKSLSRNIGAVRVAETCDEIETAARDNTLMRTPAMIANLSAALEATLAALPQPPTHGTDVAASAV